MFFNLLTAAADGATNTTTTTEDPIGTYIMLAVAVVLLIVMFIVNSRSQKKKQEEAAKLLDAIKPGNKVKTIGGICGVVVEVNAEDGTFVMETGSETAGKSYLTLDKNAIFQSDVVVDTPAEAPATEESTEAPVEETPVVEEVPVVEEAPAEETAEAPATEEVAE